MIYIQRIYDNSIRTSGARILVDRLWPRGLAKAAVQVDLWLKDVAPSNELRKWFSHDPAKWEEFRQRYRQELQDNQGAVGSLMKAAQQGDITLLYAAKDEQHNNAVVLKDYLETV